jgi:hypothetical protein
MAQALNAIAMHLPHGPSIIIGPYSLWPIAISGLTKGLCDLI